MNSQLPERTMMRWIRRQIEDRTLFYRLAMNDRVYLAIGIAWIVTAIGTGWYF